MQRDWSKIKITPHRYSDRKTYVDEIQHFVKKKNEPSPNQYNITMPWPKTGKKDGTTSEKITFLNHSEYDSVKTPGPGTYLIATHIAKKVKDFKYTENKPLQPRQ